MSARLRIGIVALATPENGGVFQYAQAAIDALAPRAEFELVVFKQEGPLEARGLEQHTVSFSRRALVTQASMAAAVLLGRATPRLMPARDRRAFERVDGFFIPSVLPYPQLFFDKPYVATLHDLQERHFPEFFSAAERLSRRATNRTVARRARRVLCESAFVKRDLERFLGIGSEKIEVVPAPAPAEIHAARSSRAELDAVRARLGLQGDYLFYPATAWPHKNHLALLRAFAKMRARHPALRLVLSGGKQPRWPALEREIAALGLRERVVHLGFLPYAELRAVFQAARALVLPTLFESISIPVYEAFALGVPVCVSNVVGLPEQVGDAALVFDPHDPAAIAAAASRVLEDPGLAKALIERGAQRLLLLEARPYGERLVQALQRGFAAKGAQ